MSLCLPDGWAAGGVIKLIALDGRNVAGEIFPSKINSILRAGKARAKLEGCDSHWARPGN